MIRQHIILAALWIGFSVLHSIFATQTWKKRIEALVKGRYRFYRISYSVFALISLSIVLIYHFTIKSISLWHVTLVEKIIAIAGISSGGFIMLLFTKRFFFDLSGAD